MFNKKRDPFLKGPVDFIFCMDLSLQSNIANQRETSSSAGFIIIRKPEIPEIVHHIYKTFH